MLTQNNTGKHILKRVLFAIGFGFAGWIILSMLAILPQKMSFPLPEFMQSYNSNLYHTGYTYRNGLLEMREKPLIEPGTFSSLNLNMNNNLQNGVYAPTDNSKVYFRCAGQGSSFDSEAYKSNVVIEEEGGIQVPLDKCSVVLKNDTIPRLYHKGTFLETSYWDNGFYTYRPKNEGGKYLDNQKIAELAARSETESISYVDMMGLLQYTYSGLLQGWYPEEQIAVIKRQTTEKQTVIYRYYTEKLVDGEYVNEKYGPYDYKLITMASDFEMLAYDADASEVICLNLKTGDKHTLVNNVTSLKSLHFCNEKNGNLIVGGIVSDNYVFVKYVEGIVPYELEEDFQVSRLVLTDEKFILFSIKDDAKFSYKISTHNELKEVAK